MRAEGLRWAGCAGIPLAIEHNVSNLIGKVLSAELTHSNAVKVTAVVNASTPEGRNAIKDIREKRLTGLSLSHEYNLFAKPGSVLKVTLDHNGNWKTLAHKSGESTVVKQMRELSVCREPARNGCFIHALRERDNDLSTTAICGMVNACKQQLLPGGSPPTINIRTELRNQLSSSAPQQDRASATSSLPSKEGSKDTKETSPTNATENTKLCLALWSVVSCAANMEATPNDSNLTGAGTAEPTTAAPGNAPGATVEPLPADPAEPPPSGEAAPLPNFPAVPNGAIAPQNEATGSSQQESAPAAEAPTDAGGNLDAQAQTMQLQQQVQATLLEAQQVITSRDEALSKLKADNAKLEETRASEANMTAKKMEEMQTKLQALEDKNTMQEKQLQESKARALSAAQKSSTDMLSQLQSTLKQIRNSSDGTVVQPPSGNDPEAVAEFGTRVAQQAINEVKELQANMKKADMQAFQQKRSRDEALGALANFGGAAPVANQMGTVNASAQPPIDAPASTRRRVETQSDKESARTEPLRRWYSENNKATWNEMQKHYGDLSKQTAMVGVVNASAGGMWTEKQIQSEEDRPRLCAMHLQPALFAKIQSMVTGRMPSATDVQNICDSVNTAPRTGPGR